MRVIEFATGMRVHVEVATPTAIRDALEHTYHLGEALDEYLRGVPEGGEVPVGEIRDQETAEIALRAAQTGHLVLSTLHTNDVVSTVTRLIDIGIEPYMLASSLHAIVAQRLVRRVCKQCGEPDEPDAQTLRACRSSLGAIISSAAAVAVPPVASPSTPGAPPSSR